MSTKNIQKTKALYKENPYQDECSSEILEIQKSDPTRFPPNSMAIVLSETVFYPEGGGQPSDIGYINQSEVIYAYKEEGLIFHIISPLEDFFVGQTVSAKINMAHRFDNMQRHSGEHILSGMFYRELGGVNRGFAMGESYMTLDISLETLPSAPTREDFLRNPRIKGGKVTSLIQEDIDYVELCANQAIWENSPSNTRYFESAKEANLVPLRKPVTASGEISIVSIGSPLNSADSVACSGTHVAFAGEVGLIKILKWENYKGMYRIYAEAGSRAFTDYNKKHEIIQALSSQFSATSDTLLNLISKNQEKTNRLKLEHSLLQKEYLELKKNDLIEKLHSFYNEVSINNNKPTLFPYDFSNIDGDKVFSLHQELPLKDNFILALSCKNNGLILFSNGSMGCREYISVAQPFGGKGGGKAEKVRLSFESSEVMKKFLLDLDSSFK